MFENKGPEKQRVTEDYLDQFIGTTSYRRHWTGLLLTDGAAYLEDTGAAWLLDAIASYHVADSRMKEEPFVVWKLSVDLDKKSAILTADDGNDKKLREQKIDYTDFPLASVMLYVDSGVIMLKSEY